MVEPMGSRTLSDPRPFSVRSPSVLRPFSVRFPSAFRPMGRSDFRWYVTSATSGKREGKGTQAPPPSFPVASPIRRVLSNFAGVECALAMAAGTNPNLSRGSLAPGACARGEVGTELPQRFPGASPGLNRAVLRRVRSWRSARG